MYARQQQNKTKPKNFLLTTEHYRMLPSIIIRLSYLRVGATTAIMCFPQQALDTMGFSKHLLCEMLFNLFKPLSPYLYDGESSTYFPARNISGQRTEIGPQRPFQ